jgi:tape measure domain-containing protein
MAGKTEAEYTISLKDLYTQVAAKMDKQTAQLEARIDSANSASERLGSSLGGLKNMVLGAFSVAAVTSFGQAIIDVGVRFDGYKIGLETMLGSAGAAHAAFEGIKQDAKTTPFDTDSLLKANRALISTGESAKGSRQVVLDLANAVAASGGGNDELQRMSVNLMQIRNLGKASAMDIRQFGYAGINIYKILSEATGKSIEEVRELDVSYDVLAKALRMSAAEGGMYAGALANMMKTVGGQISNLGDQVQFLAYELFDYLRPAIAAVVQWLQRLMEFGQRTLNWMRSHPAIVKAVVGALLSLATVLLLNRTYMFYMAIASGTLTTSLWLQALANGALTASWRLLTAAMMANPFGLIAVAIAAVVGAVIWMWNTFEGFRGAMTGVWEAVKQVFSNIIDFFKQHFSPIIEAISAVREGRWADATVALGKMAVHSVFMPAYAMKYAMDGGFTKGVADAYRKGDKAGRKSFKEGETSADPSKAFNETAGTGATTAPGIESSKSRVEAKQPTNIYVNIDKFGEVTLNTATLEVGVEQAKKLIHAALLSTVNDLQLATR